MISDPRDIKIMSKIYELNGGKGVGFGELKKATGENQKTLDAHLKYLVNVEKIVNKKYLGPTPSHGTLYTAKVGQILISKIQESYDVMIDVIQFYLTEGTKIQKIAIFPAILEWIASREQELQMIHIFNKNGNIVYHTAKQILDEKILELRELCKKSFNKKDIERIMKEFETYHLRDDVQALRKMNFSFNFSTELRSQTEILLDRVPKITPVELERYDTMSKKSLTKENIKELKKINRAHKKLIKLITQYRLPEKPSNNMVKLPKEIGIKLHQTFGHRSEIIYSNDQVFEHAEKRLEFFHEVNTIFPDKRMANANTKCTLTENLQLMQLFKKYKKYLNDSMKMRMNEKELEISEQKRKKSTSKK